MKHSLSPKKIMRVKPKGFPEGSGYISPGIPTQVTIQKFSITIPLLLPGRAILEKLILRIALVAGAIFSSILPALLGVYCKINPHLSSTPPVELDLYGKILPS